MTTNSADAVIPREPTATPFSYECSTPRDSNVLSLSEFDILSDVDEDLASTPDFFPQLESSFDDRQASPIPDLNLSIEVPSTPTSPRSPGFDQDVFKCPPSPTCSMASSALTMVTTSSTSCESLSIKAAHNSSIIMLRVSRDTSFDDIRRRLYNKFVGQEGIPLSKEFAVAISVPSSSPEKDNCSQQSHCMSVSFSDKMELHFIDTQYDWEQVILTRDSSKVTLKILDAPRR